MRYLVIGGRGFVGEWVVRKLEEEKHEVLIMSNLSHPSHISKGRDFIYGDVRYPYDVDKAVGDVDRVIHLAARINVDRSREHSRPFFDTNVLGTYNVLEACRKFKKKVIIASTSEALGSMNLDLCTFRSLKPDGMKEDHPYSPDNPYGATKAAADMLAIGWFKSFDVDVTILRSFNISGVGQSYDKEGAFIPKCINRILTDKNPQIFGSGEQTRDYVWVGDVADAYYLLSVGEYKGEVFHVGSGVEVPIRAVAEMLIDISGKNLEIDYLPGRPCEVKRLLCDSTKMRSIGWAPTKNLRQMLQEMYEATAIQKVFEIVS